VYSVGQSVIYGSHGVCTVVEIEEKTVDHKKVHYYALEPLTMPGTRYYIPVHNTLAVSKLRLPLSESALQEMLRGNQPDLDGWIVSENARKLRYKELLTNCEPDAMLQTVRLLRLHRDAQFASGRKFHVCDANFLKSAETLLSAEIAFVLGIDKAEAFKFI
jgi:CarD family transcriptional regulator